jgi:hypothetical protein
VVESIDQKRSNLNIHLELDQLNAGVACIIKLSEAEGKGGVSYSHIYLGIVTCEDSQTLTLRIVRFDTFMLRINYGLGEICSEGGVCRVIPREVLKYPTEDILAQVEFNIKELPDLTKDLEAYLADIRLSLDKLMTEGVPEIVFDLAFNLIVIDSLDLSKVLYLRGLVNRYKLIKGKLK